MTTWYTADPHFGHRNIIDLCGRPFADVDEMNDAIVYRCWEGHKRARRSRKAYLDAGFAEVISSGIERGHDLGGILVDLSHLPYLGDSHPEDRYADRRPVDQGRVLLCGHVHNRWQINERQVNVGVDVWDFQPVRQDDLRTLAKGIMHGRRMLGKAQAPTVIEPGWTGR